MIGIDPKHSIELVQQEEQTPMSCSVVNHLHSSITTDVGSSIYDNNNNNNNKHHHQKKIISSSRIRLGLRCLCPLDDKQKQLFDEIFSNNEQTTNISERILDECISRLTKNSCNTLLILVYQLQTIVLLSAFIRLDNFINNDQEKDLILRISVQEFLNQEISEKNYLLSLKDPSISSRNETCQYLNNLCSNHRYNPLLITFHLIYRSTNTNKVLFHILFTNDNDSEIAKEQFSDIFMSLALSFSSNRQKQSCNISKKRNLTTEQSLSSLLHQYVLNNVERHSKNFLYILANVKNDKQLKYWTKIQRLFRIKKHRLKMSRDRHDSSSVETVINHNNEEIWIDGPLSSTNSKSEIWIDGPLEYYSPTLKFRRKKSKSKSRSNSRRQHAPKPKTSILPSKPSLTPFLSSTIVQKDNDESSAAATNFDSESIVSSHCHLPVLPVFKDHTLLPFRSNQILDITKPLKIDLKFSTNKLNDDMEMLEKTLETLLIPSPIVPINNDKQSIISQSLSRIDQLSSYMSNDEKTKRLSRIISPTRFDQVFNNTQLSEKFHPSSIGSSVPNSPIIKSQDRPSRTPLNSTPNTPHRLLSSTKKSKNLSESNRQTTNQMRPSIFQRLFGLRSSSIPPQSSIPIVIESLPSISPLTVTLDSHDDLMPLTTSSTASSASGRASSSGYESMSNTAFEDMISSIPIIMNNENNPIKLRNKSIRKDERRSNPNPSWNSPVLRDKSHRQQRISQLKHRQNELKLELAMTKTFLTMDKNKNFDHKHSPNSTINNNPIHIIMSNTNDEDELARDIEHLEKRLATAKSQLTHGTYKKNKLFTS
ncbi:unnamed protein product [Rotaria sp. Silwood1]|nr:unnamed protein product [Rotaria sp. Silwood1]CAF4759903.1 unnamed protein product [Rotaria sp. Silwood1]